MHATAYLISRHPAFTGVYSHQLHALFIFILFVKPPPFEEIASSFPSLVLFTWLSGQCAYIFLNAYSAIHKVMYADGRM